MEAGDFNLAFDLQIQEALFASSLDAAGSSSNAAHLTNDVIFDGSFMGFMEYKADIEIKKYERQVLVDAELERAQLDLSRQVHDRAFASQIAAIPEAELNATGNNLKRPFGEGTSSSNGQVLLFRVYIKGLVEKNTMVGGIGVAICDQNDGLVFEISKVLGANEELVEHEPNQKLVEHQANEELVEMKALVDGLNVALMLDLNNIMIVTDNPLLYQYITGKKHTSRVTVAALADEMNLLLGKFNDVHASLVETKDFKFAHERARKAIALQVSQSGGNGDEKKATETCAICFEDTIVDHMFQVTGCPHSYCFSCMSKHIQFKLLQGVLPRCPHENCKSKLKLNSCKKFLTPEVYNIMSQRMKEASIPAEQKIYCPYPRCSALFSKKKLRGSKRSSTGFVEAKRCSKCRGIFCIECKVPWHANMTCFDYKRQNPQPSWEERNLQYVATQNLWRQCPKCSNMVSLAQGCYHIYCRCGHEFCYKCGAKWINKKASCTCPLWDERNIIYG